MTMNSRIKHKIFDLILFAFCIYQIRIIINFLIIIILLIILNNGNFKTENFKNVPCLHPSDMNNQHDHYP